VRIRIGHLYPDYLNIYADRGNIAVFARRAALRGHELEVASISIGDEIRTGEHDLLYIGGGQDREQALIAPDLVGKGPAIEEAVDAGAALLAVCGGYQLLGRGYLDQQVSRSPVWASSPTRCRRAADDRRRPARMRARARRAPNRRGFREPCGPDPA
jgi:CobQ-like glutamine amidotransferase family enzyme